MERRLGEEEWSPTEQSVKADEYQKAAFEKEKVIKNLEGEVESQVNKELDFYLRLTVFRANNHNIYLFVMTEQKQ